MKIFEKFLYILNKIRKIRFKLNWPKECKIGNLIECDRDNINFYIKKKTRCILDQ